MNKLIRLLKHRWWDDADTRRLLGADALQRLEQRVQASEERHSGEIRLCIEGGLPLGYLWRNASAHDRALSMFGKLQVWDTELNNGVLIYLLLADHRIEIIADRGLNGLVSDAAWREVCHLIEVGMVENRAEQAVIDGIRAVSALLALHFPQLDGHPDEDELPNRPHMLD